MQYALLAYAPSESTDRAARPIPGALATLLDRPGVTGWARLHAAESATTLRNDGRTLLTDGPFIESKDYIGGLIHIDVADLDAAIALAGEFQAVRGGPGAIEIRPVSGESPARA
jgi:hypothetical protein